ncbi:MAG: hypothetical protein WBO55_19870 [Rhizobiaceae bacterium]
MLNGTRTPLMAFALVAMTLPATAVMAKNFAVNPTSELVATKAQLAIKSPASNACPATAQLAGWIFTNKPGTVRYLMARKGGSVQGPFEIEAVPSQNGAMASFSRTINIVTAIDTEYRLLVADGTGKVLSNWAPLKANCKF